VYLGNRYGHSFVAAPIAERELKRISHDRWTYYVKKVLLNDDLVLGELMNDQPVARFCTLIKTLDITIDDDPSSDPSKVLAAARANRVNVVKQFAAARWLKLRGATT